MKRPLTILNVAYPLAPVGPDAVGGAEQVLTHLDVALARAGHHSLVVACQGSQAAGTLLATPRSEGPLDDLARARALQHHRTAIGEALRRWPVDLVHLHGVDFFQYLPPPGVPVLVTLHLPPHWYPPKVFTLERPDTYLHCVSASQQRVCPPCAYLLGEIENGVAVERFAFQRAKCRAVLALGRICPEKGFHLALTAARRANVPMLLAGEVFRYAAHEQYFRAEIQPQLDQWRRFIGPVGFERKRRLLASARCLLVPSLAPETSSLVAMEALASGTPVVAFPSGALTELVEPGKTGFLVRHEGEMAEAIKAADGLSPEVCRAVARQRFALTRTIDKYFALYDLLAQSRNKPGWLKEANECTCGGKDGNQSGGGGDASGSRSVARGMG